PEWPAGDGGGLCPPRLRVARRAERSDAASPVARRSRGGPHARAGQSASGTRARDGSFGGSPAHRGESLGKGAMARTAARRHLHSTRQLVVLLSLDDVDHRLDRPHAALRVLRSSLRPGRAARWLAAAALALVALGAPAGGLAADLIRVALT